MVKNKDKINSLKRTAVESKLATLFFAKASSRIKNRLTPISAKAATSEKYDKAAT